ncbi:hypothetical protein ACJMK2_010766 [Sinanodonta woodiana]|uniref:Uncharacterized protein n=1 Tax=Sinanodonta woodiana TaxID=1069815 RepID=A0ABD3VGF8_SINWO
MEYMNNIRHAVRNLDHTKVLELLHSIGDRLPLYIKDVCMYHSLLEGLLRLKDIDSAVQLIYQLHNYGFNTNDCNEVGDAALLTYLKTSNNVSSTVVEAFLRCNTDLLLKSQDEMDVLSYMLAKREIPRIVKELILKYMPGIWIAVERDDAMSVRRLINQWCHISTERNGKTLLQLALDVGTESIIRIVSSIGPSMDLAHGVLAGDVEYVQKVLKSGKTLNINLKNLGDKGATPLFYAMSQNDHKMVELLLQHGARLDISMPEEGEVDIPLYFAVLGRDPPVDKQLLINTIPHKPVPVGHIYYKGRNVLFFCVDRGVDPDIFEAILRKSSAYLLTQRIQKNVTIRDYAEMTGKTELVSRIDQVVLDWCSHEDPRNRKILALHGYPFLPASFQNLEEEEKVKMQNGYYSATSSLEQYEYHKWKFINSIEESDRDAIKEFLVCRGLPSEEFLDCIADCRLQDDGQPPLHKAVLRRDLETVRLLADTLVYKLHQRLDSVRDQFFRTALHYAHGMEDSKDLVNILVDFGSSEFAVDKDGRPTLSFRDRQNQEEMKDLLNYHLHQNYDEPEPDIWSVPLPLPIMGYIMKRMHSHHAVDHVGQRRHSYHSGTHYSLIPAQKSVTNESKDVLSSVQKMSAAESKMRKSKSLFLDMEKNLFKNWRKPSSDRSAKKKFKNADAVQKYIRLSGGSKQEGCSRNYSNSRPSVFEETLVEEPENDAESNASNEEDAPHTSTSSCAIL